MDYIEKEIFQTIAPAKEVAGILVEPIQGEGGYVVPPDGFLPALRRLCDKYEILLIADEVQTGMGRTGKWWGVNHWDVQPDIICSAKGIASGMPLGAIIARKEIMKTWAPGAHASTFGGNPAGAAGSRPSICSERADRQRRRDGRVHDGAAARIGTGTRASVRCAARG